MFYHFSKYLDISDDCIVNDDLSLLDMIHLYFIHIELEEASEGAVPKHTVVPRLSSP